MEQNFQEQAHTSPGAPVPFGKYLLLGRIGKGGMAEVFLARSRAQPELLAIKLMRKSLTDSEQYVEMFIREGKLSLMLTHEAIVKTLEVGCIQGRHFICMEYLSGADLTLILRRSRVVARMPIPHAVAIALRLFEGLHYAHELTDSSGKSLNLVNRDVSPSNVRISYDGAVKLLDFGIAKATSALSSEIGMLKGKISHMSPEQVRGLPLDRRSDIFSAGIILHELLTQEKLFRADSDFQLMDLVRRAEVRPPSVNNPRVPPELDALVLKTLMKDPQERFQRAAEVAALLREMLSQYKFDWSELRTYVRDLCREEYAQEKAKLESYLSGEGPAGAAFAPEGEDYGELIDISIDSLTPATTAKAKPKAKQPVWIYVLLGVSLLLLLLAIVLLVLR
jgi:eukaryotic-like serine/threonine-protein kinase